LELYSLYRKEAMFLCSKLQQKRRHAKATLIPLCFQGLKHSASQQVHPWYHEHSESLTCWKYRHSVSINAVTKTNQMYYSQGKFVCANGYLLLCLYAILNSIASGIHTTVSLLNVPTSSLSNKQTTRG
jgi:hypothetical protein